MPLLPRLRTILPDPVGLPPADTTVSLSERLRWAMKQKGGLFPWRAEIVTGALGVLAVTAWMHRESGQPWAEFLRGADWREFVVPILLTTAVTVVATPVIVFVANVLRGRAGVLAERLDTVARENIVLRAKVEAFQWRQEEDGRALLEAYKRGRGIHQRFVDAPGEFATWRAERNRCMRAVEDRLSEGSYQRLIEPDCVNAPELPVEQSWRDEYLEEAAQFGRFLQRLLNLIEAEYSPPNPRF